MPSLEELHRQYHLSLADKRAALRAAWDGLCGEQATALQAAHFHMLLHRMAGSAGTYGYPEIARRALALEQGWTAWLAQPEEVRAAAYLVCARQAASMAELLAALQDAGAGPG